MRKLSPAQLETLNELAHHQALIGRTKTFDSLVRLGLLRYSRGNFFVTAAGFLAIGMPDAATVLDAECKGVSK